MIAQALNTLSSKQTYQPPLHCFVVTLRHCSGMRVARLDQFARKASVAMRDAALWKGHLWEVTDCVRERDY